MLPVSGNSLYALTVIAATAVLVLFAATPGGAVVVVAGMAALGYLGYVVLYRADQRIRKEGMN
jgi:Flp pilus assembly protein TadB